MTISGRICYNYLYKINLCRYATEHVARINRIIRQPGGHALLVGLGGSGRQSCTKLATFIAGYELYYIEVNKDYGVVNWRNDLKKVRNTRFFSISPSPDLKPSILGVEKGRC